MHRKQSVRALASATRNVIEQLESRTLLSAVLSAGVLTITGSASADTIVVGVASDTSKIRVQESGGVSGDDLFNFADVTSITINTLAGNDNVRIDGTFGIMPQTRTVDVGDGDNIYSGGFGTDIVTAGTGDNTLKGAGGNDSLTGGSGDDLIRGGGGNDTLAGGAGDDYIQGGGGDDSIMGNAGDDTLLGNAGNDTLVGGAGNDVLAGDNEDNMVVTGLTVISPVDGNDSLSGGGDNDTLLAFTGTDTLSGGAGGDLFDARQSADVLTDRNSLVEAMPSAAVYNGQAQTSNLVTLQIFIAGHAVQIPAGAGSFSGGRSVAFTKDANGLIRFSDIIPARVFTLGEFFQQWGMSFSSHGVGLFNATHGHVITMTVNGVNNTQFSDYLINNGDQITISYV